MSDKWGCRPNRKEEPEDYGWRVDLHNCIAVLDIF